MITAIKNAKLKIKKWAPVLIFNFAFCIFNCRTSQAISSNAGTKNGDFLNLATDARGVALGDSVVSTAQGVDSLRWNAAGLSTSENKEVAGTHAQYYQSVRFENVGFAYPLGDGSALAVSAFYMTAGDLDGRDTFGNPTGKFTFYDAVGTVGYGRKVLNRSEGLMDLSVGIDVKIVEEKIADQSYQNPAFDVGVIGSPLDNLQIGLSARNLASSKANFAREIVAGASYGLFNKSFWPAFAVNYSNNAPLRASVSGEYRIQEWDGAAVRLGYTTHDALDNSQDSQITFLRGAGVAGLTLGAGFNYRPPIFQALTFGLDYAMAPFGALGISHTITVKARW